MEENIQGQNKKNYTLISTIIVVILAGASYGLLKYFKKDTITAETPIENTITPGVTPPQTQTTSYLYKDGTYSATGNYVSPGGDESVGLTVTLKDDVIVSAEMKVNATRPTSVMMQTAVKNNFKPLVIGKKIDEVKLDKVSGSSLSPKGFNDAIAKIKVQASV